MFSHLFDLYDISITWIIIISVLILIAVTYFSSKEKFGYTFLGILRMIASIFYSPIVYFKNCVVSLTEFGEKGDKELTGSKQYLLNKYLIILEGFLILLGVFVLGSGIVTSWNAFLPPKYLREQIDNTEKTIHQLDSTYQFAKTNIEQLDNDWNSKKTQLINDFKNQRQQKKNAALRENSKIESQLSGNTYFIAIKNYFDQKNYVADKYSINTVKSDVDRYVIYNTPNAAENQKADMNQYTNNWVTAKLADLELSSFNEIDLRNSIQPNYSNLKYQFDYGKNDIERYNSSLHQLKVEAKYNFLALLIGIITTVITFILYVWLIGLILEIIFLMVDLASNVKKIRTKLESEPGKKIEESK